MYYCMYTVHVHHIAFSSCLLFFSFVRSVTMDKWKDSELEKMKVIYCTIKCG